MKNSKNIKNNTSKDKKTSLKQSSSTSLTSNSLLKSTDTNSQKHKINQLWEKILKQKQRNQDYISKMDSHLGLYHQAIAPTKVEYLLPSLVSLITRLIELFERKTISDWQRTFIIDWIGDLLEDVMDISPDIGMQLQLKASNATQKVIKYKLSDEESEEFEQHMQNTFKTLVEDMYGGPVPTPEEGWDFENITHILEGFSEAQFFEQNEGNIGEEKPIINNHSTTDADSDFRKWFNQMFRRTAKALHPDKQSNDTVRERNQAIMAELSHAKATGDIVTIIQLYMTHVGDNQFNAFSELDEARLINALNQQLTKLKVEFIELKDETVLTDYAIKRLKKCAKNPKKLQEWIDEIKAQAVKLEETRAKLKSLKALKQEIEVMIQEQESYYLQVHFQKLFD